MGKITAIHAHMYRNTPHGKPQWSRPVYPDMTPENIAWASFLGEAPAARIRRQPLSRTGASSGTTPAATSFENMCHQLAFWYKALDLQIPAAAVSMSGGIHLWKDGREVPDTMSVALEHSEEILFTWDSGFGNNQLGVIRRSPGHRRHASAAASRSATSRRRSTSRTRREALGQTRTRPNAHMHDFLDCIRGGGEPNCPFELGFRVSIACRMAVESYRQGRTVRWDPAREEIV